MNRTVVTWAECMSAWSAFATAVFTGLAFGAAVWAGVSAWGTWKTQNEQLRQLEEDSRSDLASRFAIWVEQRSHCRFSVMYRNGSDLPVYDVKLIITRSDLGAQLGGDLHTLPPTDERKVHWQATELLGNVLYQDGCTCGEWNEEGQLHDQIVSYAHHPDQRVKKLNLMQQTELDVYFRDGNDRLWHRDPDGRLTLERDISSAA